MEFPRGQLRKTSIYICVNLYLILKSVHMVTSLFHNALQFIIHALQLPIQTHGLELNCALITTGDFCCTLWTACVFKWFRQSNRNILTNAGFYFTSQPDNFSSSFVGLNRTCWPNMSLNTQWKQCEKVCKVCTDGVWIQDGKRRGDVALWWQKSSFKKWSNWLMSARGNHECKDKTGRRLL